MQTSEYEIHLIGGEDEELCTVSIGSSKGRCHIAIKYRSNTLTVWALDYFECLSKLRLQLEPEGLIPFCYGASLNVFPSGMCRDMGSGLAAYRLTKGKPIHRDDLVNIFMAGHDVIPSSVMAQQEFFEDWLQSSRNLRDP